MSLVRNATGQVIGISGRAAEKFKLLQQYFGFT